MIAKIICVGIGMLLGGSVTIVIAACCMAGHENDDQEQIDYIRKWNEQKGKRNE